jgi:hypothetical protein
MSAKHDKVGTVRTNDPGTFEVGPIKGGPVLVFSLVTGVFIGILLFYFFFSRQPFWIDPLIGNAVKATVGAQTAPAPVVERELLPTYTPYATYTPYPKPTQIAMAPVEAPAARITSPVYPDGPIPLQTKVRVQYDNIPVGKFLWVVVRVPKVQPLWHLYPQLLDGMPAAVEGSGMLERMVQLGKEGPEDSGEPFDIVVLLLDEAAQEVFYTYAQSCIDNPMDPTRCSGLSLPDSGVQILDFATVVRE